jgi:hypothetical protein
MPSPLGRGTSVPTPAPRRIGGLALNWDFVGALAELVGAAAVVVSLLYLARQMREATTQAKVSNMHNLLSYFAGVTGPIVSDPDVADVYQRATAGGLRALDDDDRIRFIYLAVLIVRGFEDAYVTNAHGALPNWYRSAAEPVLADLLVIPGFRDFWDLRRGIFSDDFRALVDEMRSSEEARPFYDLAHLQKDTNQR